MQNLAPRVRLTITLCYYLSNCIQAFFATADFEFHFYEKNCNGTNRLEVILHPAFGSDTTLDGRFRQVPKSKAEYSNKAIKDLRVKV